MASSEGSADQQQQLQQLPPLLPPLQTSNAWRSDLAIPGGGGRGGGGGGSGSLHSRRDLLEAEEDYLEAMYRANRRYIAVKALAARSTLVPHKKPQKTFPSPVQAPPPEDAPLLPPQPTASGPVPSAPTADGMPPTLRQGAAAAALPSSTGASEHQPQQPAEVLILSKLGGGLAVHCEDARVAQQEECEDATPVKKLLPPARGLGRSASVSGPSGGKGGSKPPLHSRTGLQSPATAAGASTLFKSKEDSTNGRNTGGGGGGAMVALAGSASAGPGGPPLWWTQGLRHVQCLVSSKIPVIQKFDASASSGSVAAPGIAIPVAANAILPAGSSMGLTSTVLIESHPYFIKAGSLTPSLANTPRDPQQQQPVGVRSGPVGLIGGGSGLLYHRRVISAGTRHRIDSLAQAIKVEAERGLSIALKPKGHVN